ncbi:GNAT family N-acetyltransferase [Comamonas koreensis]|uniref:L-ornithine N(alpha)-acyltransferase n=1 Tax=Comamonas koreensis TaxID=160825 RepID=A0AAW4XRA9_9BURK|nr:GNAT family N-acyltransferase [Comamonas koreensis]MCD2164004.1 GNAT family N-acetyltransferase [Comamonas koreensis]
MHNKHSFFSASETAIVTPSAQKQQATLPAPAAAVNPLDIEVSWACHLDEVREAQRLRHQIFAGEMGAQLQTSLEGHDVDGFDDYCEHLLVRQGQSKQVIGTYRLLTPAQALRAGRTYSDGEFDLSAIDALRPRMVELGRSCVHPDYRQGGVIMALWGALASFMLRNKLDVMMGCASIPMWHNGIVSGDAAASIWRQLLAKGQISEEYSVVPHLPLPLEQLNDQVDVEPPALIKGYLRVGTEVIGAPAWDPDFNTADLPMLMQLDRLPPRYRKHFLG